MKTKDLLSACSVFVVAVSFATTSFAEFTEEPEEPPVGCLSECDPDPEPEKGNNGWGNGIDGDNPGTDNGNARQVSTKKNTNPAEYDLDKVERFDGR